MGNMGYAMLKGALNIFPKEDLIFTDVSTERIESVSKETGVMHVLTNAELANSAKYIILAVKPQFYATVLKNIENIIKKEL